jgi:hypothetical protein
MSQRRTHECAKWISDPVPVRAAKQCSKLCSNYETLCVTDITANKTANFLAKSRAHIKSQHPAKPDSYQSAHNDSISPTNCTAKQATLCFPVCNSNCTAHQNSKQGTYFASICAAVDATDSFPHQSANSWSFYATDITTKSNAIGAPNRFPDNSAQRTAHILSAAYSNEQAVQPVHCGEK